MFAKDFVEGHYNNCLPFYTFAIKFMKTLLTCCRWKSADLGTVEVNGKS